MCRNHDMKDESYTEVCFNDVLVIVTDWVLSNKYLSSKLKELLLQPRFGKTVIRDRVKSFELLYRFDP